MRIAIAVAGALFAALGPTTVRAADPPEPVALTGHTEAVCGLAWRPDGKALASCGSDATVRVWDPAAGKQTALLKGHAPGAAVAAVAWSPDGKALASAGGDATVRLWDPTTGKQTATCSVEMILTHSSQEHDVVC